MSVDQTSLEGAGGPRRALILAGGGTKVAFQAGVLQVWLDEAGVEFHLADGASGGVFNLAMWCQGMTGTQIADNWRKHRPSRGIQVSFNPFRSLFRLDRFRRNVLKKDWQLDWAAIRATQREATFNLYDFTNHVQAVVEAKDMTEDKLVSAVSLPMWFPPITIDESVYVDAVMATDANLAEAIRRRADELWVIWTVSTRGQWHHGFIAQYFQMIEAMANSQLRAVVRRIEESNRAIAEARHSEFDRHIDVRMLQAEVPLHYILNLSRDRMGAAVELGVGAARSWCDEHSIAHSPLGPAPTAANPTSVRFTEEMTGTIKVDNAHSAGAGRQTEGSGARCTFHLTIDTGNLDTFVTRPEHAATAQGWVESEAFGGRRPVARGRFNLFVDQDDPNDKRMLYNLWFTDAQGRPLTLSGHKVIKDHPGMDLWCDTTTLHTTVVEGHVDDNALDDAPVVGRGILRIHPLMFSRQLLTFRATGPSLVARWRALGRFGRLFNGALWDVYLTPVLPNSPF